MLYDYKESVFRSKWLSKFICYWLGCSKSKDTTEKSLYAVFFNIKKQLLISPLFLFFEVLEKLKPGIGLKIYTQKKRKVVKTTAAPYIITPTHAYKKAVFWLYKAVKARKETKAQQRFFFELCDVAFNNTGGSLMKKKEHYKYAVFFKAVKKFKW